MADLMSLDLAARGLVCDQIVLDVGYDIENLTSAEISKKYKGSVVTDHYGRRMPKGSHGSQNLGSYTASTKQIMSAVDEVFCRIANRDLLVRRLTIAANHVLPEILAPREVRSLQLDLFTDADEIEKNEAEDRHAKERERRRQAALITIKNRFGKNAIFRGMNLSDGATAIERNAQIGGHKA
jgi:DNA polymerase V